MSDPSSLVHRLSRQPRLIALLAAALVIAALAAVSSAGGGHSRPGITRPLGLNGLELAAFDGKAHIYLRVPPVTPVTPKARHASDVVLTSLSWDITTPTDATSGLPSGRRETSFTVKKRVDEFSPLFAQAEADDAVEHSATIYVVPTGDRVDEALTYQLTNVLVTSDDESVTTTGSTESMTFTFQKLELSYQRNGKVISTVDYDWEVPQQ